MVAFTRARLDDDEWWAREASRDGENPVPETGHHWQWVDSETDKVITPDPVTSAYLEDPDGASARVSLRSVEEYPSSSIGGTLPQFAIHTAEEIPVPAAGHITRHDPARVLRDVPAKRKIIDRCEHWLSYGPVDDWEIDRADEAALIEAAEAVLRDLVAPYAGHADYQQKWTP